MPPGNTRYRPFFWGRYFIYILFIVGDPPENEDQLVFDELVDYELEDIIDDEAPYNNVLQNDVQQNNNVQNGEGNAEPDDFDEIDQIELEQVITDGEGDEMQNEDNVINDNGDNDDIEYGKYFIYKKYYCRTDTAFFHTTYLLFWMFRSQYLLYCLPKSAENVRNFAMLALWSLQYLQRISGSRGVSK